MVPRDKDIPPHLWLQTKVKQHEETQDDSVSVPLKDDGSHFEIHDLYPDQQCMAFQIISKLKEFMTCQDKTKFKPLRCTIVGQGGTGKTVLLNTITSVVRRMFLKNGVVRVAAPTGVAACNVGGETLHRLTGGGLGPTCEAGSLTTAEREKMVKRFCDLLLVIIDERSMVGSTLFGTTDQIITETIHEGAMQHTGTSWGGLPILITSGDDHQLAGMEQGAIECMDRNDKGKMTEKGRQAFRECAQTVFELSTSRRVSEKKKEDRDIVNAVRIGKSCKFLFMCISIQVDMDIHDQA